MAEGFEGGSEAGGPLERGAVGDLGPKTLNPEP